MCNDSTTSADFEPSWALSSISRGPAATAADCRAGLIDARGEAEAAKGDPRMDAPLERDVALEGVPAEDPALLPAAAGDRDKLPPAEAPAAPCFLSGV